MVQAIRELDFGEGTCRIDLYIQKMNANNDASKIINKQGSNISPAVCSLLYHSQPTTAFVERSFSMLRKLLAEDRNFKVENVKQYMILHINSCTW